jgi:hypothetical protein
VVERLQTLASVETLGSTLTLSLRFELSYGLSAAHGIFHGKKIPWEGELNLRFDP